MQKPKSWNQQFRDQNTHRSGGRGATNETGHAHKEQSSAAACEPQLPAAHRSQPRANPQEHQIRHAGCHGQSNGSSAAEVQQQDPGQNKAAGARAQTQQQGQGRGRGRHESQGRSGGRGGLPSNLACGRAGPTPASEAGLDSALFPALSPASLSSGATTAWAERQPQQPQQQPDPPPAVASGHNPPQPLSYARALRTSLAGPEQPAVTGCPGCASGGGEASLPLGLLLRAVDRMYPVASPTTAGAGAAATPGSAVQGEGLVEEHGAQRRNLVLNVAAKLLLMKCRPARAASSSSVAVTVASSHADLTSRTRADGAGSGKAAAAHPVTVTRGQLQSVHMPGDKLGHAVQTELRADSSASSSPLAGRKGLLALLRSASLFKADYDADGCGWSVGLDAELVWGAVLEAAQEEERAGHVGIAGQVGALREGEAVGGEEHVQSLLVQVRPGVEEGSAGEAAQPSTHAGSVGGGGSRWEVEAHAGSARREAAQSLVQVGPAERGGAAREIRRCKHGSVSEPGDGGGRRGQEAGGQEEAKPLGRWGLSDGGGAASATGQERTSGHERTLVGDASMNPAPGAGQGSARGQTQIVCRGAGDEHAAIEVLCCSMGPARQPELSEQAASVGSSAGQPQLGLTALARQQGASAVLSGVHRAEQARSTGPDQHKRGDQVAVAGSRAPGLPGLPWAHAVELVPGLESPQPSLGGKKGAGAKTEAGRLGAGSSSGTRGDEASISGGERPTGARGSGSGRRAEGQVVAGGSSLAPAAAACGHGIFSRGGGRGPSGAAGTGRGRGGVQVDGGVGSPASAALASCGEGSGGGGEPGASARGSRSSRRGEVQVVGRGGSLAAAAVAAAVAQAPRSLSPFAAPFSLEPSLPTGMVLLRSYLSVPQQVALVSELMALGKGPGGFLTPRHRGGGRLHLRMMCLGWHWESCTNSYEASRSRHDGATPPPIPDSLSRLTAAIIADANRSSGYTQPGPFKPDVCLVNLYDATGHLGFHQDKDESQASLRKGLPVVSISIGDAADMKFGMSSSESSARVVRLQSGDVLVFGGPSRMVYHSIPRVYPGTAPPELRHQLSLGRLNLTLRQIWV